MSSSLWLQAIEYATFTFSPAENKDNDDEIRDAPEHSSPRLAVEAILVPSNHREEIKVTWKDAVTTREPRLKIRVEEHWEHPPLMPLLSSNEILNDSAHKRTLVCAVEDESREDFQNEREDNALDDTTSSTTSEDDEDQENRHHGQNPATSNHSFGNHSSVLTQSVALKWLQMGEKKAKEQRSSGLRNSNKIKLHLGSRPTVPRSNTTTPSTPPRRTTTASLTPPHRGTKNIFRRSSPISRAAALALQQADTSKKQTGRESESWFNFWSRSSRPGRHKPAVTMAHTEFAKSSRHNNTSFSRSKAPRESFGGTRSGWDRDSWLETNVRPRKSTSIFQRNHEMTTSKWRTAVDPSSGRTYYYHVETRETQWRKPMELATRQERKEMEEKEQKQRDFFAAMEVNILKAVSRGAFSSIQQQQQESAPEDDKSENRGLDAPIPLSSLSRPALVRTISSMEETVLVDLIQRVPSNRNVWADSLKRNGGDSQESLYTPAASNTVVTPDDKDSDADTGRPALARVQRSHRGSLVRIDEKAETSPGTLLQGLPLGVASSSSLMDEDDDDNDEHDHFWLKAAPMEKVNESNSSLSLGPRQQSFGKLLAELPKEGQENSVRSFDGSLGESKLSFNLSSEESLALEELAKVTDQMTLLEEDDDVLKTAWTGNTYLTDIAESADNDDDEEDNDDTAEEIEKAFSSSGGMSQEFPEYSQASLPSLETTETSTPDKPKVSKQPTNTRPAIPRPVSLRGVEDTVEKPPMERRNTCGTLYVGSTMANPDVDATIKCVCGVYRAHILQSETIEMVVAPEHDLFNDMEFNRKSDYPLTTAKPPPPTLDEITAFYRDVFRRAKMESDCIIISLIYVERLIKVTKGALRPQSSNWRSILFSCMVLSSKVWDDLSMWNADFSKTCPAGVTLFTLKRINELEVAVLSALNYQVKVPASEYAKYYFLLRSMLIKSGLGGDEATNPLDVEGARRLQHVSSLYQSTAVAGTKGELQKLMTVRSKSVGSVLPSSSNSPSETPRAKVGLEHVVLM